MSEEILKALMRLFAIIVKQDEGVSFEEREFVKTFLAQQLTKSSGEEYLTQFDDYTGVPEADLIKRREIIDSDSEDVMVVPPLKLTSVKDSVRTLGICKKINKTLSQKQKVVVLVRLYELISVNRQFTSQRMEIIETVSEVFNISADEHQTIKGFVTVKDPTGLSSTWVVIINDRKKSSNNSKHIISNHLKGDLAILKVESVDLYFLRYAGASDLQLNGLALNSKNTYLFANGSTIKVPSGKPIYYSDISAQFLSDKSALKISFNAKNIIYKFSNGNIGLRNISVSESQGKLIGIMGASGAGKTTLLNTLSGVETPAEGEVLINNINIHRDKDKLEGIVGYIPQDDFLIEELSVFDNLYYNAKLCFKDYSDEKISELVIQVLANLDLLQTKNLKVGSPLDKTISGGQRKRLNIALELIRKPAILFVDEPTSGLSSRDSENVMDLLRELALKGQLVFVVIHQPSSDIYKMFDKVIFLDTGGYLIYDGNPVEAISYFKRMDSQINADVGECLECGSTNPELIFNIVEAKVVDEFGHFTKERKISPEQWAKLYKENMNGTTFPDIDEKLPQALKIPSWIKQWMIFSLRDLFSKLSNKQYLLINLLEAPVLALILSFIVKYIVKPNSDIYLFRDNDNIPSYIFMSVIVVLFLGLTVSAEEIFRDRKILKRESLLNLSRSAYLFSKLGILFVLSAIQTLSFVLVGNTVLEISSMYLPFFGVLFSTCCLANVMGLNISATFNSAVTIYIIIPLLIIPAMILGGAMFSYNKLNKAIGGGNDVPLIAAIMPSRWAYEALVVNQFVNNEYEKEFFDINKSESMFDYKQVYYIPELMDIVDECKDDMIIIKDENDPLYSFAKRKLSILKNEIEKENKLNYDFTYKSVGELNIESFNDSIGELTKEYLDILSSYYGLKFNANNLLKEYKIIGLEEQKGDEFKSKYTLLLSGHHNDYLEDVVRDKFNKNKITRGTNSLVQLIDPIYKEPEYATFFGFGAHFFAAKKYLFGKLVDTYVFNTFVIWLMSAVLYAALYYNLFKKAISVFTKLNYN